MCSTDTSLSRREFLGGAAAFAALPKLAALAELTSKGRSYSVPVLGDIHFDSPDPKFYHANYKHSTSQKRYKAHLAEHVRNSEMWKERLPRLVRASGACLRKDAAFALQMGDLVQGDCGNAAMHRQMLDDAVGLVKGAYGGNLPLVTVAGNHDIRGDMKGDGAKKTLEKWLPETMAKELGVPVKGTTFSFRQGPDVFIVVDFNEPRPDFALLKRLLAESEDARYTFIVSHGPVIPSGQMRWFLLGKKKRDEERRELRTILARRNAIALEDPRTNLSSSTALSQRGALRSSFSTACGRSRNGRRRMSWATGRRRLATTRLRTMDCARTPQTRRNLSANTNHSSEATVLPKLRGTTGLKYPMSVLWLCFTPATQRSLPVHSCLRKTRRTNSHLL